MDIHVQRSRFDRIVKQPHSRATAISNDVAADLQSHHSISRWALLVVGVGGLATTVWALMLGWFVLQLLAGMVGWLWN